MTILFDTDAFFALNISSDSNHAKARELLKSSSDSQNIFYVSNLVIQETATVLSHKANQKISLDFVSNIEKMPIEKIIVDQKIENKSWEIFKNQHKNKISFIDCSNLAILENYKLDYVFSFDHFYRDKRLK